MREADTVVVPRDWALQYVCRDITGIMSEAC
jgi:hypothetical protein